MKMPYFHYNPNRIFHHSKTPAGLYARQKWMQQEETNDWKSDFGQTINELLSGQQHDGSWGNSLFITVHRLFGLHLTLRNRNERIEKAMEWLFALIADLRDNDELNQPPEIVYASDLRNLPFSRGCYDHVLTCSILFLASLFGYAYDDRVITGYEMINRKVTGTNRKWCNWSCSNNFLRACIVHPAYRESRSVRSFISSLQKVQMSDGGWPAPIPFYQTVNALGHLDDQRSDDMLSRAFGRLRETQSRDGTWGRTEKEWHTFLIVHAIKRKASLLETMQGAP